MPARLPGTERARDLRRNQTKAEGKLWAVLRGRGLSGFKFRRQQPVGRYVADFLCEEAKLIVELGSGKHADQVEYDEGRTAVLEAFGYRVLRFWNNDVLEELDGVVETIDRELRLARS